MLKIGYHKTAPVDYVKTIFIMVVSFGKRIGNHIHIFLKKISYSWRKLALQLVLQSYQL